TDEGAAPRIGFEYRARFEPVERAGMRLRLHGEDSEVERFELELVCCEGEGGVEAALRFDAQRYAREDVERIGRCFVRLLSEALAAPQTPLGSLEVLSEGDRDAQ